MNSKEEFTVQMKRKVAEIEEILKEYLPKPEGYQKVIMEAMEYSLMAGGKRLRPMLMRETSRLFGDETEALCPFMAALEMIHTYSLVHDDLPAMDNDEYRRGRKTTHIVYGEDMGILAGDALLNYAFETAFRAFETAPQESLKIGRALSVLGRKAGVYGMIGGQVVEFKHVFYSWVCMAVLFVVAYLVRRRLTLVPGGMQNFFEALIDTIENFICNTMGEAGRRFVPLLAGMFIYIFGMNLLGLIPGFDAPTANLNTTVSMALFVLVFYNALGIIRWKAHYVHHFTGPSKFLIPLMFPLEIVSHLSRPVSLSLRLFGNIRGEEIVMVLFFVMAPILGTIPIYALFLLGKTMQAFVFFMLTMFYIKGAIEAPEH